MCRGGAGGFFPGLALGALLPAACAGASSATLAEAAGGSVPECTPDHLSSVQGFMIDLDGTMYGDLSRRDANWSGLIDGALDFERYLVESHIPSLYLSDTGAKGSEGVDAKLRALGMSGGPGPERVWTAARGLATFLGRRAPLGSRLLVLDSSASFDGRTDSCVRVIRRTNAEPSRTWEIRTDLSDEEAKLWSAGAKAGGPVFVVYCADDQLDASADGGKRGWTYDRLKRATWLLANGAVLAANAPDNWGNYLDPAFPDLQLLLPGPGPFLDFLRTASTQRDGGPSSWVIGKGGNGANEFMFSVGMAMLRRRYPGAVLDPSHIAMVGDNLDTDVLGGQNFGTRTIWLTRTGVHRLGDLAGHPRSRPSCHLPSVRELHALLLRRPLELPVFM